MVKVNKIVWGLLVLATIIGLNLHMIEVTDHLLYHAQQQCSTLGHAIIKETQVGLFFSETVVPCPIDKNSDTEYSPIRDVKNKSPPVIESLI